MSESQPFLTCLMGAGPWVLGEGQPYGKTSKEASHVLLISMLQLIVRFRGPHRKPAQRRPYLRVVRLQQKVPCACWLVIFVNVTKAF